MTIIPVIGPVIEAIGSVFKSWLEVRKVKAQGQIAIAQAKVQAAIQKEAAQAQMDLTGMDDMKYSWKDEYLVILLSIPVIMCFIPDFSLFGHTFTTASVAMRGFQILDQTPDWYRWALTGIIAASFGLRTWTGFKK